MRKYLDLFNNVIKTAKEQSINILSPQAWKKISEIDGFVRTDGDPKISDKELEVHHIEAITKSDLVFIINPSWVVWKTTFAEIITTEFFWKPILFLEKIDDSEEKIIKDIYNSNIFYQNVLNTHRSKKINYER